MSNDTSTGFPSGAARATCWVAICVAAPGRFATTTGVKIHNNLTNVPIRARDDAIAELASNRGNATAADFVDLAAGNLHLAATSGAVSTGTALPEVPNDFDGQPRPQGGATDVGADEYTAGRTPNPPTDLAVN